MNRRILIWSLAIAVALVAALLFTQVERYRYVRHASPPPWVERNTFYAAETLLNARGHAARTFYGQAGMFPLPDTDSLLILARRDASLDITRVWELLDWVNLGGHLMVLAVPPHDTQPDALMSTLGITVRFNDEALDSDMLLATPLWQAAGHLFQRLCLAAEDNEAMLEECTRAMCGRPELLDDTRLVFPDHQVRRIGFNTGLTLTVDGLAPEDLWERGPEEDEPWLDRTPDELMPSYPGIITLRGETAHGMPLLQQQYGDGLVTVVTDLGPWTNSQLHYLDHAWLLDHFADDRRRVWFVHGTAAPPLMLWLWQQAAPLIVSLLLLLALVIWRALPRREPLRDDPVDGPADFMDHLLASGRLLWREQQGLALLSGLREAAQTRLHRHDINDACRLSGLAPDTLEAALNGPVPDEATFLHYVTTLQTLRRSL